MPVLPSQGESEEISPEPRPHRHALPTPRVAVEDGTLDINMVFVKNEMFFVNIISDIPRFHFQIVVTLKLNEACGVSIHSLVLKGRSGGCLLPSTPIDTGWLAEATGKRILQTFQQEPRAPKETPMKSRYYAVVNPFEEDKLVVRKDVVRRFQDYGFIVASVNESKTPATTRKRPDNNEGWDWHHNNGSFDEGIRKYMDEGYNTLCAWPGSKKWVREDGLQDVLACLDYDGSEDPEYEGTLDEFVEVAKKYLNIMCIVRKPTNPENRAHIWIAATNINANNKMYHPENGEKVGDIRTMREDREAIGGLVAMYEDEGKSPVEALAVLEVLDSKDFKTNSEEAWKMFTKDNPIAKTRKESAPIHVTPLNLEDGGEDTFTMDELIQQTIDLANREPSMKLDSREAAEAWCEENMVAGKPNDRDNKFFSMMVSMVIWGSITKETYEDDVQWMAGLMQNYFSDEAGNYVQKAHPKDQGCPTLRPEEEGRVGDRKNRA